MIDKLVGFYTSRPFWALDPVDFRDPHLADHFTDLMSEIVYRATSEAFSLQVCRDGLLMLQVPELEDSLPDVPHLAPEVAVEWWGKYLDYFNCLYLLLDSAVMTTSKLAYFDLAEVTNRDVFRVLFEDGLWKGASIAQESLTSVFQRRRFLVYHALPLEMDPLELGRVVVRKETLDLLVENLQAVAASKGTIQWLSGVAKALSEYKIGNYPTCLTLAWFVIESVVHRRWERLLDSRDRLLPDGSKRISADRRRTLRGRDYPMSVITNILELFDILPYALYRKIDIIRGHRNNVVHQDPNYSCKPEHCQMALEVAKHLALEGTVRDVRLSFSYSVLGP
jgi:hypothetical protein